MTCEEVERQLLTGKGLDDQARQHLTTCESCQAYKQILSMVDGTMPQPSLELDHRVLEQSRQAMAALRRRRLLRGWIGSLVACAACVILVVGLVFAWHGPAGRETVQLAVSESHVSLQPLERLVDAEEMDSIDDELLALEKEVQGLSSPLELDLTVDDLTDLAFEMKGSSNTVQWDDAELTSFGHELQELESYIFDF